MSRGIDSDQVVDIINHFKSTSWRKSIVRAIVYEGQITTRGLLTRSAKGGAYVAALQAFSVRAEKALSDDPSLTNINLFDCKDVRGEELTESSKSLGFNDALSRRIAGRVAETVRRKVFAPNG